MRILLLGYYGQYNIGDDLMLLNLLDFLNNKAENIDVIVNDDYYKMTTRYNTNINFVNNKYNKYRKIKSILKADLIIWGGGTCFYDNTGLVGLKKYFEIAKFLNKKFVFLGVGIGNLSGQYKQISDKIIQKSDYLFVRDKESYEYVKKINSNVCFGGDLVFLKTFDKLNKKNKKKLITNISFSGIYLNSLDIDVYKKLCKEIVKDPNMKIHFLPAHKQDMILHREIAKSLPKNTYMIYRYDIDNFINVMSTMDFHIGMRLHSIILADILGIPNIGIEYSPKIRAYLDKYENLYRLYALNQGINMEEIIEVLEIYNSKDNNKIIESEEKECLKCLRNFEKVFL